MIDGEIMVKVTIDKLASEDEVTFFGCNIRFSNLDSESLGGCSWEGISRLRSRSFLISLKLRDRSLQRFMHVLLECFHFVFE